MSRRRPNSPLDLAYAEMGLVRMGEAERSLNVTHEAFLFLIQQRQLKPRSFTWKGKQVRGIPASQLETARAVFKDGTVRLVRVGS